MNYTPSRLNIVCLHGSSSYELKHWGPQVDLPQRLPHEQGNSIPIHSIRLVIAVRHSPSCAMHILQHQHRNWHMTTAMEEVLLSLSREGGTILQHQHCDRNRHMTMAMVAMEEVLL